ncbi:MAG: TM2 domain-containing protein [Acidobacteria bacterium]|nr:TM2 domain-containing protein [Acidobacteriota bacterium]
MKARKSLEVAYILWFLLGCFGAHRFYLGRSWAIALLLLGLSTFHIPSRFVPSSEALRAFDDLNRDNFGIYILAVWWTVDGFSIRKWAQWSRSRFEVQGSRTDDLEPVRHPDSFSVFGVLGMACLLIATKFWRFFLLGLVVVPVAFLGWGLSGQSETRHTMASLFCITLLQGLYVGGVFDALRGRRSSVLDLLSNAARAVFRTVFASVLLVHALLLLVTAGALPLLRGVEWWFSGNPPELTGPVIALGVFVALSVPLCLVVPNASAEQQFPVRALRQSIRLTKGARTKLFGLLLVLSLTGFVGVYGMRTVLGALWLASFVDVALGSSPLPALMFAWGGLVLEFVFLVFSAVATCVAYHDLRAIQELSHRQQQAKG